MNYYLWIAGKEHGPYSLDQVKEAVIEGTVTVQQTARRGDSNDWVPLGTIIEFVPEPGEAAVVTSDSSEPVAAPKWNVKDYLAYIRDNSCYGVLRSIIEVCTALALIAAIFSIIGGALFLIKQEIASGLYAVGSGVAGLIVIAGIRQAALLLIDIADTLLHHHSKTQI